MIFIVPDTNILYKSPLLQSEAWISLDQHRDDWAIQVALPEIVFVEHVRNIPNDWRKTDSKVAGLHVGTFGAADEVKEIRRKIRERIDCFEADFKARLDELEVEIVETPAVPHLELAERATYRTAPYQAGDKDGYRDTVIWLTVLSIAENHPDAEVWFVSDNTADFASAPNWTGPNAGNPTDCPILFHPQLQKEVESKGLQGRVKYVKGLQSLEQHLAAINAPISDDEVIALVSELDGPYLSSLLEDQMKGRPINPSEAALSLNTASALVVDADSAGFIWRYSDAARRGEGRWTANFDITVSTTLQTTTYSGDVVLTTKYLSAGGRITFTETPDVESLELLTVEAMPDDPNRSLWTAEAQLERIQATQVSLDFLKQLDLAGLLPKVDTSSMLPGVDWAEVLGSQFDTAGMLPGFNFTGIAPHIDTSNLFGRVGLSNIVSSKGVWDLIRAAGEIAQAKNSSSDEDSDEEKPADSPQESAPATDASTREDSPSDSQKSEEKDDR